MSYHPLSLLSEVCEVFEKLVNNRIVDHLEKYGLFFISSILLDLLDQLQIFSQLYLIELLGASTGRWLLKLRSLIYPRLFTGFGTLVFFTNVSLMGFQVRYLALFLLFSVIDGFEWLWMKNLHKNIQIMLEILKALFLVVHFSYYTLMTFLTMLSDIAIHADDTPLCSKCDQIYDLGQQLWPVW